MCLGLCILAHLSIVFIDISSEMPPNLIEKKKKVGEILVQLQKYSFITHSM